MSVPVTPSPQTTPLSPDEEASLEAFDQVFGSMAGTMVIVGDIVNPDAELWDCERD